jgi:flagellar biosynthesis/type III secretory pathway protein FliH
VHGCDVLEVHEHSAPTGSKIFSNDLGPEAKDVIMTAGQRLIEQGRQQGFEQGYQEGLELGRQRCREIMLHWLRQRFEQDIATASYEKLETWSARVVSAATLAELFAD